MFLHTICQTQKSAGVKQLIVESLVMMWPGVCQPCTWQLPGGVPPAPGGRQLGVLQEVEDGLQGQRVVRAGGGQRLRGLPGRRGHEEKIKHFWKVEKKHWLIRDIKSDIEAEAWVLLVLQALDQPEDILRGQTQPGGHAQQGRDDQVVQRRRLRPSGKNAQCCCHSRPRWTIAAFQLTYWATSPERKTRRCMHPAVWGAQQK